MRFLSGLRPTELAFILLFGGLTLVIMQKETKEKGYITGLLGSDHMVGPEIIRTLLFVFIFLINLFPTVFSQFFRGQYLAISIIGLFLVGLVVEVIGNIIIINCTHDAIRDRKALLDTGKDLVIILLLAAIILRQNPSALF